MARSTYRKKERKERERKERREEENGKDQSGEWSWVRAEGKTSYGVKWNHQITSLRR